MENELQTRQLNASTAYTAYYVDALGADSANSGGAQFFLPDDEDSENSGDKEQDSLANDYDLGKQLSENRTIFSDKSDETVSFETSIPENDDIPAPQGVSEQPLPMPMVSDTRALVGLQSLRKPGPIYMENFSGRIPLNDVKASPYGEDSVSEILYNVAEECDALSYSAQGTHSASVGSEMTRTDGNNIGNLAAVGIFPSSPTRNDDGDTRQNGENFRRQAREYFYETNTAAGAAAVASFESSGNGGTSRNEKNAKSPRVKEISQAILDEIERMRTNPDSNSVDITLDLSGGESVSMRLRWHGGDMRVTFGQDAEEMRPEIENGWGSLVLSAGNSGISLETPCFDTSDSLSTKTGNYA